MKTAALLALALLATPALAETSTQREACTPDVWRLCASDIPNVGAITQCLRRERARLSDACRTAMGGDPGTARPVAAKGR
ncbi:hypothetical protein Q8W71_01695 [Methylobacterium sp. NEAU 140]|uniref:hypothetical protein n=1 Tax=Methylobacterium sp. NEAU 140 TaxID=3064945 RepID=UPI0027373938|nr:hypothetical protein [Methylobacterium sp. NEAU 140]MDP4021322.1 hypothetical protein [Methylobacterium sp. NEAU 140]